MKFILVFFWFRNKQNEVARVYSSLFNMCPAYRDGQNGLSQALVKHGRHKTLFSNALHHQRKLTLLVLLVLAYSFSRVALSLLFLYTCYVGYRIFVVVCV